MAAMIVDGKAVAAAIYDEVLERLRGRRTAPRLTVFTAAPNAETQKFLELKQRRAAEIGIAVTVVELDAAVTTEAAEGAIRTAAGACDGIVVQLPFPAHIDPERLLAAIPAAQDIDAIGYHGETTEVLPPVVGAIAAIAACYDVEWEGQQVVVVGRGRLVGKPAAFWAEAQNAAVTVIDEDTADVDAILQTADIIISGAGVPGLITPARIRKGAIIFDAGTSEAGGQLRGDADPAAAEKCALFTPVPGGIGPVTIAVLLRNLAILAAPEARTLADESVLE